MWNLYLTSCLMSPNPHKWPLNTHQTRMLWHCCLLNLLSKPHPILFSETCHTPRCLFGEPSWPCVDLDGSISGCVTYQRRRGRCKATRDKKSARDIETKMGDTSGQGHGLGHRKAEITCRELWKRTYRRDRPLLYLGDGYGNGVWCQSHEDDGEDGWWLHLDWGLNICRQNFGLEQLFENE